MQKIVINKSQLLLTVAPRAVIRDSVSYLGTARVQRKICDIIRVFSDINVKEPRSLIAFFSAGNYQLKSKSKYFQTILARRFRGSELQKIYKHLICKGG